VLERMVEAIRSQSPFVHEDRPLGGDTEALAPRILAGRFP
jgi:hypothetical protein